jgi:hypothetical protein
MSRSALAAWAGQTFRALTATTACLQALRLLPVVAAVTVMTLERQELRVTRGGLVVVVVRASVMLVALAPWAKETTAVTDQTV